ncbi:uncharacterized protein BO88DRAFT_409180 [Aspergillus vadensis CBS 113365]|uniref:Uncharacterized protein n=1 Tax=Aspergillus vadensis (strain CBS 113365 / IMI 142717 / IBT 24658) TaxID=1448311 RepID=A0A319C3W7_ASPVC|nr:hypothetical protein BO88DRAFT_409180 [Aspergillus vadensis CBS 113365]PYH63502.1 hypothetical protein BO88DRAFT_409180 [Aspergillus vadensis CBS 113365]
MRFYCFRLSLAALFICIALLTVASWKDSYLLYSLVGKYCQSITNGTNSSLPPLPFFRPTIIFQ